MNWKTLNSNRFRFLPFRFCTPESYLSDDPSSLLSSFTSALLPRTQIGCIFVDESVWYLLESRECCYGESRTKLLSFKWSPVGLFFTVKRCCFSIDWNSLWTTIFGKFLTSTYFSSWSSLEPPLSKDASATSVFLRSSSFISLGLRVGTILSSAYLLSAGAIFLTECIWVSFFEFSLASSVLSTTILSLPLEAKFSKLMFISKGFFYSCLKSLWLKLLKDSYILW